MEHLQAENSKFESNEEKKWKSLISDKMLEHVAILSKLELNDDEKEQVKNDMSEMLCYIDKLNELDVTDAEPMSHIFSIQNVFREDEVCNGDGRGAVLLNAPEKMNGGFKVPKTIS